MTTADIDDPRRAYNPLFNDNKLKLGTFGTNVRHGCAITTIDGVFETTWPNTLKLAQMCDDAGFESIIPVARWRGFGGETNFNGGSFETYTWAAGLGATTSRAAVLATSHVPTVHPLVAAKQVSTIDHITQGRFALNIVCGWFEPELQMFGAPLMDHEARYEYAEEWLAIMKRLWTEEDEFDFDGKYFNIKKGFHQPKPFQQPFPALMNAGGSERGRQFAAKNCDMMFIGLKSQDLDGKRAEVAAVRDVAREEYGRDIQIWTTSFGVIGDTDKEAQDFHDYYVHDKGDWEAATNLTEMLGLNSGDPGNLERVKNIKARFIAGWGGNPLIGTPEHIVDGLETLSEIGIDGTLISFARYEEGLARWIAEVMPLMEQAGLRQPLDVGARA